MAKPDRTGKPIEEMNAEELQAEILRVELETKTLQLAEARQRNHDFIEVEKRRRQANQQRMTELETGRKTRERIIKICRHRSGGTPKNILKGSRSAGSFSLLTRAILPDGKSVLIQCPRCRLMAYPPNPSLKKEDPKRYAQELEAYNSLLEQSIEEGLEHAETRGPTFLFERQGVPIIPDRV